MARQLHQQQSERRAQEAYADLFPLVKELHAAGKTLQAIADELERTRAHDPPRQIVGTGPGYAGVEAGGVILREIRPRGGERRVSRQVSAENEVKHVRRNPSQGDKARATPVLIMYFDNPVTGEREQRSTKKTHRRDAEREAAKWEAELREGRYRRDSRIDLGDIPPAVRRRKTGKPVTGNRRRGGHSFQSCRATDQPPSSSPASTPALLSRFQAELRKTGSPETSIAGATWGTCDLR